MRPFIKTFAGKSFVIKIAQIAYVVILEIFHSINDFHMTYNKYNCNNKSISIARCDFHPKSFVIFSSAIECHCGDDASGIVCILLITTQITWHSASYGVCLKSRHFAMILRKILFSIPRHLTHIYAPAAICIVRLAECLRICLSSMLIGKLATWGSHERG